MVKPSQKILSKSTANKDNSGSTNSSADATAPPVNHGGVVREKRTRRSIPRDSRPPQRSSIYRGVTRHRWTGRFEAHLWDKNCWNESQNKKGRQGAYDDEEAAAHAYDLAALVYWGKETNLNFPASTYQNELKEMEGQSREEYIGSLRSRKSNGFSRGVSKYRGVASRHHHNGKWEARIGRVFGNKYLYLGTYATQEEAAIAYDMAAIEYRGINAVTNFDLSRYFKWLQPDQGTIDPGPILPFAGGNDDGNLTENQPGHDHNHNMPMQSTLSQGALDLAAASTTHQPRPSSATSAVGLLLRPSELREMVEMTPAADGHASLSPEESSADVVPNTCSFPEDIQTYFEWQQEWSSLEEGDSSLFGELNTFGAPLFHYDLIDSMDEQGNGLSMEW
ncbi:hypothetical protein SAY87_029234 [Trapa incisa]|uniref:AP2/ERF domain-containing protein n=1 Tax=Trapa incisa TaxID=236973 RepID=A0AAN7QSS6_9MYRT|nr:hypothetical protein SAY87_029234 [Trapa incisa]